MSPGSWSTRLRTRHRAEFSIALVVAGGSSWAGLGRSAPAVSETQDRIVVEKAASRDAAVVIVHGQQSGDLCPDDESLPGGGLHLIENVVPPATCQVAVFSKYHPVIEVAPGWTAGADSVGLTLAASPLVVAIDVYVVTDDKRADGWARSDVRRAVTLFRRNRVGLTFSQSKFAGAGSLSEQQGETVGDGCSYVDGIKATSSLYDPNRINVFFVNLIEGDEDWRGSNCFVSASGNSSPTPNVIFVSLGARSPTTLAHELGHAFGLQLATGHTGPPEDESITGFKPVNIMWDALESDEARDRNHFSLGQAYRMNASDRSWVQLASAGPSSGGLPGRKCHPSGPLNKVPCPPLAFDVPGP